MHPYPAPGATLKCDALGALRLPPRRFIAIEQMQCKALNRGESGLLRADRAWGVAPKGGASVRAALAASGVAHVLLGVALSAVVWSAAPDEPALQAVSMVFEAPADQPAAVATQPMPASAEPVEPEPPQAEPAVASLPDPVEATPVPTPDPPSPSPPVAEAEPIIPAPEPTPEPPLPRRRWWRLRPYLRRRCRKRSRHLAKFPLGLGWQSRYCRIREQARLRPRSPFRQRPGRSRMHPRSRPPLRRRPQPLAGTPSFRRGWRRGRHTRRLLEGMVSRGA